MTNREEARARIVAAADDLQKRIAELLEIEGQGDQQISMKVSPPDARAEFDAERAVASTRLAHLSHEVRDRLEALDTDDPFETDLVKDLCNIVHDLAMIVSQIPRGPK